MYHVWSALSPEHDQPGMVANPARGQLNEENIFPPVCPRSRLLIWSHETGSAVPSRLSSFILHITCIMLNLVLPHQKIPPAFRERRYPHYYNYNNTINHHRPSPE